MLIFFFNDTATTEIYTLSLHDALPISERCHRHVPHGPHDVRAARVRGLLARGGRDLLLAGACPRHLQRGADRQVRSEEHTSELQSRQYLVCRLLLEKKKTTNASRHFIN